MADINEVVVRGSAAGFAQEILAGRHPLTADEPVAAAEPTRAQLPTTYYLLPWAALQVTLRIADNTVRIVACNVFCSHRLALGWREKCGLETNSVVEFEALYRSGHPCSQLFSPHSLNSLALPSRCPPPSWRCS
jgi:hypothetical protein